MLRYGPMNKKNKWIVMSFNWRNNERMERINEGINELEIIAKVQSILQLDIVHGFRNQNTSKAFVSFPSTMEKFLFLSSVSSFATSLLCFTSSRMPLSCGQFTTKLMLLASKLSKMKNLHWPGLNFLAQILSILDQDQVKARKVQLVNHICL